MRFISILLGLATAVSAIDIYFHTTAQDCSGDYLLCPNVNPDGCCGIASGTASSLGFRGIPTNWYLELRGYESGKCRVLKELETAYNTNFMCLDEGSFTGAEYSFRSDNSTKRAVVPAARSEDCTPPEFLILANGKKYSLAGMSNSQIEELTALTSNGSPVPDEYKTAEVV
ncbi:hypothetical protein ACMFMG_011515 [Clarireedia jacksonii]